MADLGYVLPKLWTSMMGHKTFEQVNNPNKPWKNIFIERPKNINTIHDFQHEQISACLQQVGAFVCSTWCDLETFKLLLKQLNSK